MTTTTSSHTGLYSAFGPDTGSVTDLRLTTIDSIAVPLNAIQATLSFFHQYDLEANAGIAYDGGVLEISTDGGASWVGASIASGGYNYTIPPSCPGLNPLAGRQVWSGDSGGWRQVTVNLFPYRGRSVLARFHLGTDDTGSAQGWWIDDVSLTFTQSDCFSPTPVTTFTATATVTPTPTPAPILVVHVIWPGIPQPSHSNSTMTLELSMRLTTGGTLYNFIYDTDASGFFTAPVGIVPLPNGTYNVRAKGAKSTSTCAQVTLTGAPQTNLEMGDQPPGDANNDDVVNAIDFALLRNTFGRSYGQPGYDPAADFDNNDVVNATDFVALKNDFNLPLGCPVP